MIGGMGAMAGDGVMLSSFYSSTAPQTTA